DDAFDLFGDMDQGDQHVAEQRMQCMAAANEQRLDSLRTRPASSRTAGENRWVLSQLRKTRFPLPQTRCSVFSPGDCKRVMELVQPLDAWTSARHSSFATVDIPVLTTPALSLVAQWARDRVVRAILEPIYGFAQGQLDFRDLFLVKYTADGQRGLAPHADGGLISFSILINDPANFDGGGTTFFPADGQPVLFGHAHQGDLIHHPAQIRHQGNDITRGERLVLVGFVDTRDSIDRHQNSVNRRI
ncbi:hypothetical protein BC940DRAFT_226760, partial [Gongronella butleri]